MAFNCEKMLIVGQLMFPFDTNGLNEQEAKCGAIYIFLTKKWVNVVVKYETILKNKVQSLL